MTDTFRHLTEALADRHRIERELDQDGMAAGSLLHSGGSHLGELLEAPARHRGATQ